MNHVKFVYLKRLIWAPRESRNLSFRSKEVNSGPPIGMGDKWNNNNFVAIYFPLRNYDKLVVTCCTMRRMTLIRRSRNPFDLFQAILLTGAGLQYHQIFIMSPIDNSFCRLIFRALMIVTPVLSRLTFGVGCSQSGPGSVHPLLQKPSEEKSASPNSM